LKTSNSGGCTNDTAEFNNFYKQFLFCSDPCSSAKIRG
jgi:hypothetical protein